MSAEYDAMMIGLGLDRVPVQARERVQKEAAKRYGWVEAHWATRTNAIRMVRAMRWLRDRYQVEGVERGVQELDREMHALCSGAGVCLANLKT
jgi:hypothetical protein